MYREINTIALSLPSFDYFQWDGKVDHMISGCT
jgi:hypothetical protein